MTPDDRKATALLVADLDFLTGRAEFIRFIDRIKKQRDDMADAVLRGEMTAEQREIARNVFLALDDIVESPEIDKNSAATRLGITCQNSLSISS
jgi:uncharacterized protein related to proFAR isomerase